jgi:hypothetical protein
MMHMLLIRRAQHLGRTVRVAVPIAVSTAVPESASLASGLMSSDSDATSHINDCTPLNFHDVLLHMKCAGLARYAPKPPPFHDQTRVRSAIAIPFLTA